MQKIVRFIVLAVVAGTLLPARPATAEPARFTLDPEHTSITFFVHHLGYADVAGMFRKAEGSFTFDQEAQELADLEVTIDTASVFTNHERRDEHLRGPDFFDVEAFPTMTFVGTDALATGDTTGTITGELTLLGVTRPVTLEATFNKAGRYPFGDEHYAIGIDATTTIRRSDFGMTYGVENDWVGDEVEIVLGLEAKRAE